MRTPPHLPSLALAAAVVLGSADAATAQRPSRARLQAFVDSIASAAVGSGRSPALSIAVARGSEPLIAAGYGLADLENEVRATDVTVFRIGSITKQFTAAAIMQLVEQGKVSLDDDLTRWLPDWPTGGRRVTVRQLLNHTGGLHNYTSVPRWRAVMRADLSHDSLLALVRGDTLDFEPGTRWSYSNTGYFVLGMIVEKASGQRYADFVRTRFVEPLGLTGTSYCETTPIIKRRAHGYAASPQGWVNAPYLSMSQPYAAGALCSTVRDLVAWTRALEGGRVVRPETYRQMTTPLPLADGKPQRYGYGLGVGELDGHRIVSHNGGINGFRSQMASYPGDSLIVVVLSNGESPLPDQLEKRIARRALGLPGVAVRDLPVSAADAARYAGSYAGSYALQGGTVEVRLEGGRLVVVLPGSAPARLLHQGEGVFVQADDPDHRLRFVGSGARAERVELSVPGQMLTLPRR